MINGEQQIKREKWNTIIAEYEKSGISQVDFCKQHDLSSAQFGYYRGLLKPKKHDSKKSGSTFTPVKINQHATISEIRLTLPNGFQCTLPVEIDASRVKELIGVLLSC